MCLNFSHPPSISVSLLPPCIYPSPTSSNFSIPIYLHLFLPPSYPLPVFTSPLILLPCLPSFAPYLPHSLLPILMCYIFPPFLYVYLPPTLFPLSSNLYAFFPLSFSSLIPPYFPFFTASSHSIVLPSLLFSLSGSLPSFPIHSLVSYLPSLPFFPPSI